MLGLPAALGVLAGGVSFGFAGFAFALFASSALGQEMLGELRGARILEGVRGRSPADVPSVIEVLLAISRLAEERAHEVAELDINPLLVLPAGRGAVAVDALAIFD